MVFIGIHHKRNSIILDYFTEFFHILFSIVNKHSKLEIIEIFILFCIVDFSQKIHKFFFIFVLKYMNALSQIFLLYSRFRNLDQQKINLNLKFIEKWLIPWLTYRNHLFYWLFEHVYIGSPIYSSWMAIKLSNKFV